MLDWSAEALHWWYEPFINQSKQIWPWFPDTVQSEDGTILGEGAAWKLEDSPRCEKLMNGCSNDITRWVTGSGWRIEGTIDVDVSLCFGAGNNHVLFWSRFVPSTAGYCKPVNCKPSCMTRQRSVNPQTAWCSHLLWKLQDFVQIFFFWRQKLPYRWKCGVSMLVSKAALLNCRGAADT